MDIPNLDATETEDLVAFAKNLRLLGTFVSFTIMARTDRLKGDIQGALEAEFSANCCYRDLPDDWRW
jgi:hypothetical protein